LEPQQLFDQATIIKGYMAQNSEDTISSWERTLLAGDLNPRDRQYYRDNRVHMSDLQCLEYLCSDDYTNHREFEDLQWKYGNTENSDGHQDSD